MDKYQQLLDAASLAATEMEKQIALVKALSLALISSQLEAQELKKEIEFLNKHE